MNGSIEALRARLQERRRARAVIVQDIRRCKRELRESSERKINVEMAASILSDAVQVWKRETADRVDSLVSDALSRVFEDDYEFATVWATRRGKVEADFIVRRDGGLQLDIMTSRGGSIRDITAFVLRLVVWRMSADNSAPLLLLDEPFRSVSETYQSMDNVREMLIDVSASFGIQIFLITHEIGLGNMVGTQHVIRDGALVKETT